MIVALDFDRTYARAPEFFNALLDDANGTDVAVWCITRREDTPENRREIEDAFGKRFPLLGGLILCGPNVQKEDAATAAGITVDVWIDDSPEKIPSAGPEARSTPMNIERRTLLNTAVSFPAIRVEKRSEEVIVDGAPQQMERDYCVGYASVFGLLSLDLGDFVERIDSRAFDKVLSRRGDDGVATRALWNHNSDYPLGRHPETLVLTPDEKGLRYEFPFGRASYAQDLRFNIDDGIVTGSSFGFVVAPGGERWSKEAGRNVRTVTEIEALYDVSPTTYPAYPDSDVAVAKRSFHHAMESGLVKPPAPAAPRRSVALREWIKAHGRQVG
jgi:HK97 family phage prohead protease